MHETSVAEYVENHRDQRAGWQHLNKQKHQFDRDRTGKCHNLNDSGPEKAMKKNSFLAVIALLRAWNAGRVTVVKWDGD